MRRRLGRLSLTFLVLAVGLAMAAPAQASRDRPTRVLIVVLDQFRPDLVDIFDMRNVRTLSEDGVELRERLPRAHGVRDGDHPQRDHQRPAPEGHGLVRRGVPRQRQRARRGPGDSMWITGSLTRDQFNTLLIAQKGYPKLGRLPARRVPGHEVHHRRPEGLRRPHRRTGRPATSRSRSRGRNFDCDGDGANNWRGPTGVNVPTYISAPSCGRFYVDSSSSNSTYGTGTTPPAWMYPLDGNRFVVGRDPAHLGGDVWTTDAGLAMMEHEPWSGMLLTLGSIDKASHMWGGITDDGTYPPRLGPGAGAPALHRQDGGRAGRPADAQADGARPARRDARRAHHRPRAASPPELPRRSTGRPQQLQLVLRRDAERHLPQPSPSLAPLHRHRQRARSPTRTRRSARGSPTRPTAKKREAAAVMATLPSVIATLPARRPVRYRLTTDTSKSMTQRRASSGCCSGQEIVDTMAAPYAADVVGLLKDNTSYGVAGDHGGAQRPVQEIPIVFGGDGVGPRDSAYRLRSVDILPTVLREMGIKRGLGPRRQGGGAAPRLERPDSRRPVSAGLLVLAATGARGRRPCRRPSAPASRTG